MTTYEWYIDFSQDKSIYWDRIEKLKTYEYDAEQIIEMLCDYENLYIIYESSNTYMQFDEKSRSMYLYLSDLNINWVEYLNNTTSIFRLIIKNCLVVPNEIFKLNNIKHLELINCNLDNLSGEIFNMYWLEGLDLKNSKISSLPQEVGNMINLEVLSLMHTNIDVIPNSLSKLKKLKYLGLNGLKIDEIPHSISELVELECLYLGKTKIKELPVEFSSLKKLKHLALWETNLQELPEWVCEFKDLQGLYLGRTIGIKKLPERIGNLVNLKKIYLDGTNLNSLPNSFGELINLEEIMLARTYIRKFPQFKEMKKLVRCDLSGMTIERVPKEFINAIMNHTNYGLCLHETKILMQPASLFLHDKEFVNAYYEEKKIHLNETKIVFLGDGEAGKSHIIERFKHDGEKIDKFEEESTPGIAISQKQCCIGAERINLQIWDFGGQEIMHSMHRFFLTERTLYVIVINARDNTQDERAKYWLNNIKSFANGCPVILVLNKIDQNPSASMNERLLRDDYPQIVDTVKMSALNDDKQIFSFFEKTILNIVKTFDSYAMDFPISWNNIKSTLTNMPDNYIVDSEYRKICVDNNVEDEQIQNWLLDWFHDLGVSFNYRKKDRLLGGYMILKPNWITNAIYIILFNGTGYARNGLISIQSIVDLLEHPPKAVEKIKYNIIEVPYIMGVMRRFEISYSIDDENEFIPMMCNKNQHNDVELFLTGECLQYYMEYEYLPNNVLHKLMIKMQNDLDKDKLWLTGMILETREKNISAMVRIHNKKIEIFIKSADEELYPSREYLCLIRENLIKINNDLNLMAEDMIIYKEDQKVEAIKYSTLLIHLSSGQNEYFSTVFRKNISIRRILGLIEDKYNIDNILEFCKDNDEVTYKGLYWYLKENIKNKYKEFEDDLIECCTKLQGNTLEILQGNENDRNTYLRDLLSINKKYIVYDQTLNGLSSNKKAAGELDLLIKDTNEYPITILEALILNSVKKTYIAEHINKIYLYDTWGLPYNYIIVYVESSDFNAFCARYYKYISEYEYPFPLQHVKEKTEYTELRVFDTVLLRSGKETVITHILMSLMR